MELRSVVAPETDSTNQQRRRAARQAEPADQLPDPFADQLPGAIALQRWCALAAYPGRRLRACPDPAGLDRHWRAAGAPQLSPVQHDALRRWLSTPGQSVLWRWAPDFPPALAAIPDPPLLLFAAKGTPSVSDSLPAGALGRLPLTRCCAIVGSRAASQFARRFAERLAGDLVTAGVTIVSGLAQGIDRAAHEGALAAGGGTVAVLGAGLGRVYPRSHAGLARRLLEANGMLLSEYAPWVGARRSTFPERNRLISGLSSAVVVVQAAPRSGSLITARTALEQGREVLAVPGLPGTGGGAGTNALLRDGAALVESAADVLEALGWQSPALPADDAAMQIAGAPLLQLLDGTPTSLAQLAALAQVPVATLAALLSEWEMDGLVEATAEGYIRCPAGGPIVTGQR